MSLHGEIKVNHEVIGHWQARRISDSPAEVNVYECKAADISKQREISFEISHNYAEGAITLASKVIAEADRLLSRCGQGCSRQGHPGTRVARYPEHPRDVCGGS